MAPGGIACQVEELPNVEAGRQTYAWGVQSTRRLVALELTEGGKNHRD